MAWRGALATNLKEIRFVFCAEAPASKGLRDFVAASYPALKSMNPNFPLLVRESKDVSPRVMARCTQGKEKSIPVANMKATEVAAHVEKLAKGL